MGKVIQAQRKGKGTAYVSRNKYRKKPEFRRLDFNEKKGYIKGVIRTIKHEPGRGAPVAEVVFRNSIHYKKDKKLLLATEGMYAGQFIYCGKNAELKMGNVLPVGNMPEGTICSNLERQVGDGGSIARSSGESCVIISHAGGKTRIRLPSGTKKTLDSNCRAMIGIIAGGGRTEKPILKAGTNYYKFKAKGRKGRWPVVRGVAKNPVEHPHGGGNHQHIGMPSTVKRNTPHGRKVGLIAARRTGRIRGSKAQ